MTSEIGVKTRYTDRAFKEVHQEQAEIVSGKFYDCTFIGCRFAESLFRTCRFLNCAFQRCDLSFIQVPGSTFSLTRFEESKMIGIDWTRADWSALATTTSPRSRMF